MSSMKQDPVLDFEQMLKNVLARKPFTFIRFSDGEMEILRNNKLFIGDGKVQWSKGEVLFPYPDFDRKDFVPDRDQAFRHMLTESAVHRSNSYLKGVPAQHNRADRDRDWMIELNGGILQGLTFADLFINSNFRRFRSEFLPALVARDDVAVLGNFRMEPRKLNENWKHVKIQDNFIPDFELVLESAMEALEKLPHGYIILASASSLSNVAGFKLNSVRPDLTFIDIGTSLHDLMGLTSGIREYHFLVAKPTLGNLLRRARYYLTGSHKLEW